MNNWQPTLRDIFHDQNDPVHASRTQHYEPWSDSMICWMWVQMTHSLQFLPLYMCTEGDGTTAEQVQIYRILHFQLVILTGLA